MYQLEALQALIGQQHPLSIDSLQAEQQQLEAAFLQILYSERTPESIRLYIGQHVEILHQWLRQQLLEEPVVTVLQRLL